MYENNTGKNGGSEYGASPNAKAKADEAKEHLRAAKDAASEAVRGEAARAREWSRTQYASIQERVEAEPFKAAAWALGIGFVAGVLLTALGRSGRR